MSPAAGSSAGLRRSPMPAEARALEPQLVLHAVEAGLLALEPQRGTHRAGGIGLAAEGAMAELQPLAGGGEHDRVHADLLAAAQGGEADLTRRPRAGMAVAALAT